MPEVTVRPARPDDAPEMVRLAAVMFESMGMDASGPGWRRDGEAAVRRRLGDDIAAFVVDEPGGSGRLVASAVGTMAVRLPTPANPTGLVGYVQWVCTEAEWRGKGLGRAVMTALLDWYAERGVTTVELHATADGEPLYRSLGFSDKGPAALRRRPAPPQRAD